MSPKLELIYLPKDLAEIRAKAFEGCANLNKVELPSKLKTIGDGAFIGCINLTELISNSPDFVVEQGYLRDTNNTLVQGLAIKEVDLTNTTITALRNYCFAEMPLESIKLPDNDNFTAIPQNAFTKCTQLTQVTLPSELTTIGATSFWTCRSLTEVTLPSKLARIGTYAFAKCSLERITIPAGVTDIGNHAFGEMTTLKEVTFESSTPPERIDKDAFNNSSLPTEPETILFNCPWSETEHMEKYKENWTFGAKHYIFNFGYKEAN
jgi:hypothetical protein